MTSRPSKIDSRSAQTAKEKLSGSSSASIPTGSSAVLLPHAVFWISLFLIVAVAAIYSQSAEFEFVNYDDGEYVYDNPHVLTGLTKENLKWAFTERHASNWHPLTWLSHMLDAELFGSKSSGGPHLMNASIHAVTSILLFLALGRMTGSIWSSGFVAAVFAVHPLRVESVAWISERKDLLSGFFFALVLWLYSFYVRRPSSLGYFSLLIFFSLGLMSKPMLVTLPCVLLLLDFWPLSRFAASEGQAFRRWKTLVVEKIPLFALSAGSAAATIWAQEHALIQIGVVAAEDRFANAAFAYVVYVIQLFWPSELAVLYPHPLGSLPAWKIVGCSLLLAFISLLAVILRRRCPYLLMGWLWYLGMLVPVIGILQVGEQSHADRYSYLPHIGLLIAATWGFADWSKRWKRRTWISGVLGGIIIVLCAVGAWRQAAYWHDTLALFERTLRCTENNPIALNTVAIELHRRGRSEEALENIRKATRLSPRYMFPLCNGAAILFDIGRYDEALGQFREAERLDPNNPSILQGIGGCLYRMGRIDEAETTLKRVVEINPHSVPARITLGLIAVQKENFQSAVDHFDAAIELDPASVVARYNLAKTRYLMSQPVAALRELKALLRSKPDYAPGLRLASWIASTSLDPSVRSAELSADWAERAVMAMTDVDALSLDVLAAAHAEGGQFQDAIAAAEYAEKLLSGASQGELRKRIAIHLERFRTKKPLREAPAAIE